MISNQTPTSLRELLAFQQVLLDLAGKADWESLTEHAAKYIELSEQLIIGAPPPAGETGDQTELLTLCLKANDELLALIAPRMDSMKRLFRTQRTERAVAQAYGASS